MIPAIYQTCPLPLDLDKEGSPLVRFIGTFVQRDPQKKVTMLSLSYYVSAYPDATITPMRGVFVFNEDHLTLLHDKEDVSVHIDWLGYDSQRAWTGLDETQQHARLRKYRRLVLSKFSIGS